MYLLQQGDDLVMVTAVRSKGGLHVLSQNHKSNTWDQVQNTVNISKISRSKTPSHQDFYLKVVIILKVLLLLEVHTLTWYQNI